MRKKLFCLITTIALVLGLLPLSAMANDHAASVTINNETTTYPNLDTAVVAASEATSATITLLKNVEEVIRIGNGDITLDLNGKTWTSRGFTLTVENNSKVKIIDSVGGGIIQTDEPGYDVINLSDTATLEVAGGRIQNENGRALNSFSSGRLSISHLIISGGYIVSQDSEAITMGGKTLTISGGTISSNRDSVYIHSGTIDLSEHLSPQTVTFYVVSDAYGVPTLDNNTLILPEGFQLYNTYDTTTPLGTMERGGSYIIKATPPLHHILVEPSLNGSVYYSGNGYYEEEILLEAIPEDGYVLDFITAVDEYDNPVFVWDNSFIMPDADVTISATFREKQAYTASLTVGDHGTATLPATLFEGALVELNISPDEGYTLDTVTVTDANGNEITVHGNGFIMPSANITVDVTFRPAVTYSITVPEK